MVAKIIHKVFLQITKFSKSFQLIPHLDDRRQNSGRKYRANQQQKMTRIKGVRLGKIKIVHSLIVSFILEKKNKEFELVRNTKR